MNLFPPFDPDAGRSHRRRLIFRNKKVPVRFLIPNFFTLLGLCAGLSSIRMAIEHRYDLAIGLIVLAAFLDGVDGRVARLLKGTSRFGAELDSLADFVNFGVAPAVMIFTWGLGDLKSLGWIVVLIFAICSSLRLARFNAALDEERPQWQTAYFVGVPAPAAAIIVLLPLYLDQLGMTSIRPLWPLILFYTLTIALLMVSSIPTFSGKLTGERVARDFVLPIFVVSVLGVILLVTYPFKTLTVLSVGYLAHIPYSFYRFGLREKKEQALAEGAAEGDEDDGADSAYDTVIDTDMNTAEGGHEDSVEDKG